MLHPPDISDEMPHSSLHSPAQPVDRHLSPQKQEKCGRTHLKGQLMLKTFHTSLKPPVVLPSSPAVASSNLNRSRPAGSFHRWNGWSVARWTSSSNSSREWPGQASKLPAKAPHTATIRAHQAFPITALLQVPPHLTQPTTSSRAPHPSAAPPPDGSLVPVPLLLASEQGRPSAALLPAAGWLTG